MRVAMLFAIEDNGLRALCGQYGVTSIDGAITFRERPGAPPDGLSRTWVSGTATAVGAMPHGFEARIGLGGLLANSGYTDRAVELLGSAARHPAHTGKPDPSST